MLGFNKLAGTNYLFVSRTPDNPSLLDLMGAMALVPGRRARLRAGLLGPADLALDPVGGPESACGLTELIPR